MKRKLLRKQAQEAPIGESKWRCKRLICDLENRVFEMNWNIFFMPIA
jgi:hypothetical protein